MPTPIRSWSTPSSQGTTTYETVLYDDRSLSCNCPGWIFSRNGKPRACKHTKLYSLNPDAPIPVSKKKIPTVPKIPSAPTSAAGRSYSFDEEEE